MIVAAVVFVTAPVLIMNVADVAPAGIVKLACNVASPVLDVSAMLNPPVAAGPDKVTVPTDLPPPETEEGDNARLIRVGGLTVRTALFEVLPSVAASVEVFTL